MTARYDRVIVLCAIAVVLNGCAQTIVSQTLIPERVRTVRQHEKAVSVQVTGGRDEDPLGMPTISNTAFADAVTNAINNSKLFSSVVPSASDAKYALTIMIASVQQPVLGYTMTVSMDAGWRLQNRETGQIVWQKGIRSSSTLGVGDAFIGMTRVRLATEGAARENIRQGLEQISLLEL